MGNNITTTNSTFFDELDPVETGFLFLEAVIIVPTISGNILILVSMRKFQWLKSPLNTLIGNLAFSDLLTGILLIPFDIFGTFFGLNRLRIVCLLQLSVLITLMLVSLLSMLAISAERYFSVAFPWDHRAAKRRRHVHIFMPFCWILSLCFSMISFFCKNDMIEGKSRCLLTNVWPYELRTALGVIVLVIITVKIILFSLVVKIAVGRLPHYTGQGEDIRIRRQLAKTYILMAISAIFILCWAPYCVITFFNFFIDDDTLKFAQGWTLMLGLFNTGLNWLIYGLKNTKIRHAFKLILCNTEENRNSLEMDS